MLISTVCDSYRIELPDGDDVHHVLRCVQRHPEIPPLLQLNAAVQAGGAPQLRDPVHSSTAQSTINPHPGRQPHVSAGRERHQSAFSGQMCINI